MAEQNMFEHLQQLFASARAALRPILPKWLRGGVPIVPVVRLAGVIGFSTPLKPGLTLATVARPLERAFKMRHARAVALLINSPGGSPVQSHLIYRRIRQLAAENTRPVIVFAEDVAASGGYMIACAGDEIFCDPSSILGSIGVVGSSFGFPKLMEKLGVERRLYVSGEHKAMLDPFLPEKAEDVERLKALQQEIHQDFIGLVKRSRGARLKGPEKTLFSGEYWSGRAAGSDACSRAWVRRISTICRALPISPRRSSRRWKHARYGRVTDCSKLRRRRRPCLPSSFRRWSGLRWARSARASSCAGW